MNTVEKNPLNDFLTVMRKEVNRLATDDMASVFQNIEEVLEEKITRDPYRTLATALGVGYGLSALSRAHFKHAAIHVGKLVAMKAISNMDSGTTQSGETTDEQTPSPQLSAEPSSSPKQSGPTGSRREA